MSVQSPSYLTRLPCYHSYLLPVQRLMLCLSPLISSNAPPGPLGQGQSSNMICWLFLLPPPAHLHILCPLPPRLSDPRAYRCPLASGLRLEFSHTQTPTQMHYSSSDGRLGFISQKSWAPRILRASFTALTTFGNYKIWRFFVFH